MDSLFPAALNNKTCANCGHSKPSKLFPRRNEWCRLCLQRAHDATPPGKKFCTLYCKDYLPLAAFATRIISSGAFVISSACKVCSSKRAVKLMQQKYNAVETRDKNLQKNHGITLMEFEAMSVAQGGVCAICKLPETYIHKGKVLPLAIDHDHEIGTIRGLLCSRCNRAIGLLHEDLERMQTMMDYIRRHKMAQVN